jgi:hypothetical protein
MPAAPDRLRELQYRFAGHIRDPRAHPAPADVSPRRMAMYRELFYNNIEGFLRSNFPVLRRILDDARWTALGEDFFARHRCKTPYFSAIAEEFLEYLAEERGERPEDPPFLLELAHYEWVEMALAIAEDCRGELVRPVPDGSPRRTSSPLQLGSGAPFGAEKESLLDIPLCLSELAWPLAYRFPVHEIGPDFQPTQAPEQPTCLVVYRDSADQIHFTEITPPTYRLLQLWRDAPGSTARMLLEQVAAELGQPGSPDVLRMGAEIARELVERGVLGKLQP